MCLGPDADGEFPDIAVHLIQTPQVGRLATYRQGLGKGAVAGKEPAFFLPCLFVGKTGVKVNLAAADAVAEMEALLEPARQAYSHSVSVGRR